MVSYFSQIHLRKNREVLQAEFRLDFWKGPRQISVGPGWSTPEEVEPKFLFRFGSRSIDREKRVADSPHRHVQEDYQEVEFLLLLDHNLAHRNHQ